MNLPSKIFWSEGLILGPQQFQQQDLYHEARLHRIAQSLNAYLWGVRKMEWRLEDLANNALRADAMSLIFQDGEIYDAPAADPLPAPIDLSRLPAAEAIFTFYAALPILRSYGGNVPASDGHHNGARYTPVDVDTADLFSDAVSTDVAYLKKTVRLLSHLEPLDSYVSFPVIRVRRVVDGGFEIDPTFIAPSLSVGAADRLAVMLDNLVGKLKTKIETLYSLHRQPRTDVFEFHSGDLSSFWLLNALNTAGPGLIEHATGKDQHPRHLFQVLRALAGSLTTFSSRYALGDLPLYDHADPAPKFAKIDAIIRDLIDTVISSRYFTIPLIMGRKTTHYRGTLDSAKIDQSTEFFLAVNADMPAVEIVAAVPRRFKIGAPDDVENFIMASMPGIALMHMPQVPAAIPMRPNTFYFSISKKGALYENMLKAQAISMYVPDGMKDIKLELLALMG